MANLLEKFRKWRKSHKKAKQEQSNMGFVRQLFRSQRGRYSQVNMAKEQKKFEFQELNEGDSASLHSNVIVDPNDGSEVLNADTQENSRPISGAACLHYDVMDLDAVDLNQSELVSEEVAAESQEEPKKDDPLDDSDYYTKRAEQVTGDLGSNSMECLDVYFKPPETRKSFRRSASVRKIKRAADASLTAVRSAIDDMHTTRPHVPQLSSLGKAFRKSR